MDFNSEAKTWDTDLRVKRAEKISKEILGDIEDKKIETGLELGCGTGLISFNLKDRINAITLVDNSKGMIEELDKKIEAYNIKNMKTWFGDIVSLEEENRYDLIYTSMAMHHILNLEEVIKKLYRLLKTDGKLIIVDLMKEDGSFHSDSPDFGGHDGFEPDELKKILEKTGFRSIGHKVFYRDKKEILNRTVDYELFIIGGNK